MRGSSYRGLCSKYSQDKLARVEGSENTDDNVEVGGGRNVGLKANIAELLLRSYVYSDILSKPIVFTLLPIILSKLQQKIFLRFTFCRTPFNEYPQGSNK